MSAKKSGDLGTEDHYRLLYQNELEMEAEWLRRGAAEKANSIEMLLARNGIRPKTMMELGCGVGAVIGECRRRGLAEHYMGVDSSQEALDYMSRQHLGLPTVRADITEPSFRVPGTWDVVVVSHVLEHLSEPRVFLSSIRGSLRFSYLLIEVPLENLAAGRAKAWVHDRRGNKAGHVQFFTVATSERLIATSGFRILDRRTYVPVLDHDTIRFVSEKDGLSLHRRLVKAFTGNYLPRTLRPLWKTLYYAHHAVLCAAEL